MIYSVPYIIFFCFVLFLNYQYGYLYKNSVSIREIKQKRCVSFSCCFLYALFFGLRGYVFTDCFQYEECFLDVSDYMRELDFINYRFEPVYVICNYIISLFTDNFFVFQFIWTIIDVIFLHYILKRECKEYYLLAFALLLPFFMGVQMNLFRNEKSILIFFLLSLRNIRKRSFYKFFITIILAFLFHSSALFYLPFFWILRIESKKIWTIICATSVLFYFVGLSDFFGFINAFSSEISVRYSEKAFAYTNDAVDAGFTFGFLFRLVVMTLFIFYYERLVKYNKLMINVAIVYLCVNMAFNSVLVFRDRFSVLFSLGIICSLPYLFRILKEERIIQKSSIIILSYVFLWLGSTVYLYVQTNNPAAYYENIIFSTPDRNTSFIRISTESSKAVNRK